MHSTLDGGSQIPCKAHSRVGAHSSKVWPCGETWGKR